MIALSIEPAITTLLDLARRSAGSDGLAFSLWTVAEIPVDVWRIGSSIEITPPDIAPPPEPPVSCSPWLRAEEAKELTRYTDRPAWSMVIPGGHSEYGEWGSIPPDIQIAISDFLSTWKAWEIRQRHALKEEARWCALNDAHLWTIGRPDRSLWLEIACHSKESPIFVRLRLNATSETLTLTLAEHAIDTVDIPGEIVPVSSLAKEGSGIGGLRVIRREMSRFSTPEVVLDTAQRLAGLGLETATLPIRTLNDPRLVLAGKREKVDIAVLHRSLEGDAPWLFLDTRKATELMASVMYDRAEARNRMLCIVPDDDALKAVERATSDWLPVEALPRGMAAKRVPRPPMAGSSALEDELRTVTSGLDMLVGTSEDRKRRLAEGPFAGEDAIDKRMALCLARASETLPAYLEDIDWKKTLPLSDHEVVTLRDLLALPDSPKRILPPADCIPSRETVASLASHAEGHKDCRKLIAELLIKGPPASGHAVARRQVEHLEKLLETVENAAGLLPSTAVNAVLDHLDDGLEELASRTLSVTSNLIGLVRRVAGHTVTGLVKTDLHGALEAARRHHASLANPDPNRWHWKLKSDEKISAPLSLVRVDGNPCTTVDHFRILVEWIELELQSPRSGVPQLVSEWNRAFGPKRIVRSSASIRDLHYLAILMQTIPLFRSELNDAAKLFGTEFPEDTFIKHAGDWVRCLRTFVDAQSDWQAVHLCLEAVTGFRKGGDGVIEALVEALTTLDVLAVERHRAKITAYHEEQGKLARRRALIDRVAHVAPAWAAKLGVGDPWAAMSFDDPFHLWDLARLRAWQADPSTIRLVEEEAKIETLRRRREALTNEIRVQRLREALASAMDPSCPPIRLVAASAVNWTELLDSGPYDLLIYLAGKAFSIELYASLGLCERVVVIGTGIGSHSDAAESSKASIRRLLGRTGLIRVMA